MVTKLEHARAFKQMNIPLNTPVEERIFSAEYTRHWVHLMSAQDEFMQAVNVKNNRSDECPKDEVSPNGHGRR